MSEQNTTSTTSSTAGAATMTTTTSTAGESSPRSSVVPSAGVTPQTGQQAPADWTSGLDDTTKGYVQTKGFKDPASVLESYRNMEKLLGVPKERLLQIPENTADKAAMDAFYSKLGRPEKPEGYGVKAEGADQDFLKWATGTFHELGLSKDQGLNLVNKWGEYAKQFEDAQKADLETKIKAEQDGLKKKWGAAYDKNLKQVKAAMTKFGVSAEKLDAIEGVLGYSDVMELMSNIGATTAESNFVSGDKNTSFTGELTPSQAAHRISMLKTDQNFIDKLMKGDVAAKNEWGKLHEYLAAGAN